MHVFLRKATMCLFSKRLLRYGWSLTGSKSSYKVSVFVSVVLTELGGIARYVSLNLSSCPVSHIFGWTARLTLLQWTNCPFWHRGCRRHVIAGKTVGAWFNHFKKAKGTVLELWARKLCSTCGRLWQWVGAVLNQLSSNRLHLPLVIRVNQRDFTFVVPGWLLGGWVKSHS